MYLGCCWDTSKLILIKRIVHIVVNACENNSGSLGSVNLASRWMSCKDKMVLFDITFSCQDFYSIKRYKTIACEFNSFKIYWLSSLSALLLAQGNLEYCVVDVTRVE